VGDGSRPPRTRSDASLDTFTADAAAALPGPDWLRRRRRAAYDEFASMPLPSEKEEVWRYSPIDRFDLSSYRPVAGQNGPGVDAPSLLNAISARATLVTVRNGVVVSRDGDTLAPGVTVGSLVGAESLSAAPVDADEALGNVVEGGDLFVRMNDAYMPDAVVIDVAPGSVLDAPVVVAHLCDGSPGAGPAPAVFPRTTVRVGRGAQVQVVEVVAGAPGESDALVVPVTELYAGEGASLAYVALQVLGERAWHVARLGAFAERDAAVRTFTVGLGAAYDRCRLDAAAGGPGAHCELRSAYLGTGDQVHDVRTLQDHRAPHTTSDLLCKGAVAGRSRSVYSGLIRVRHGATRTEAMQTNHNLVLDQRAHADSVPNLDIEENDVRCSHASTVGPVDEDQRYYLESRGVPRERAERLIVLGFFTDLVGRMSVPSAARAVGDEVGRRLAVALEGDDDG
jgi:Fe-S cluster assembly protein SufD